MAIDLNSDAMKLALEKAIGASRSSAVLPEVWLDRVLRLGQLRYHKTYMAALGGALLARSTDDRVDCLTHKNDQGVNAYQLRKAAEFLTKQNNGRYHMGAQGKNPVNNSPFYGSKSRIDEFTGINSGAKEAYGLFLDCMLDLNKCSAAEALRALSAYLKIRIDVAQAEARESQRELILSEGLDLQSLLRAAETFVNEESEGGRRGQAFVAAVLDCAFEDVILQKINSPHAGDVRIMRNGHLAVAVEVKQVPVDEATGLDLAREAKVLGADAALLVVFSSKHSPLNRERIRRASTRDFGIGISVAESVRELVHQVSVFGGGRTADMCRRLPETYFRRLIEHEASPGGIQRWRDLMEARVI